MAVVRLQLGPTVSLVADFRYDSESLAEDGETALRTALYAARQIIVAAGRDLELSPGEAPVTALGKDLTASLRGAKVERVGREVTATVRYKVNKKHLAAFFAEVKKTEARVTYTNNGRQLGLALHNFNDAYGLLPAPAFYGAKGEPLLSWRVAILPFIGQDRLYREFRLNEPWDSAHNKKLLAKMPAVFAPPPGVKTKGAHETFWRVFTGPQTAFPEPALERRKVGGPPLGELSLQRISAADGVSNTIGIVEAAQSVPWTKPDELSVPDKGPLPKLGALRPDRFHAVFLDNAVRSFKRSIPAGVMRALITPQGGESVNLSRWEVGGGPGRARTVPSKTETRPPADVKPDERPREERPEKKE
jgi:hypothetical protein